MPNTKLSGLDADTNPEPEDLLYVVINPGGTPAEKKVTIQDVVDSAVSVRSIVKQADESKSEDVVMAADDELKISVPSAGAYSFTANIYFIEGIAGALRYDFNFGAGGYNKDPWNPDVSSLMTATLGEDTAVPVVVGSSTLIRSIEVHGFFVAGGVGTFQFRWRQGASTVDPTVVKAGSSLTLRGNPA